MGKLYYMDDYRKPQAPKLRLVGIWRRTPVVNLAWLTLKEFKASPNLKLTAHMERICECIDAAEKPRSTHPRVSERGIALYQDIFIARGKDWENLTDDLMHSKEKNWVDHPNYYLAMMNVIEQLTPPPTDP